MKLTPLSILILALPGLLAAGTVTFDESAATNGTAYSATVAGATFGNTNAGTWGGLSNGDPGDWSLQGTNGPQFLGFNNPYSETVTFTTAVNNFSADFSRSGGSADGTIVVNAYNGATLIGSTTVVLGAINTWSRATVIASGITSVTWTGSGTDFHPYGVDNVNFNFNAVPTVPALSTWAMAATVLLLLGSGIWLLKRRQDHLTT